MLTSLKVAIVGDSVYLIGTDSPGITAIFMLVYRSFSDQVFSFIAWISNDWMHNVKAIAHRDSDLGTKLIKSSCLASGHGANVSLVKIDNACTAAARLDV